MTSLREMFTKKQQTETERLRASADKELLKIAKKLPKKIEKCVRKGKGSETVSFDIEGDVDRFLQQGKLKDLAGYKRMHDICASAEIDMKLEIGDRIDLVTGPCMPPFPLKVYCFIVSPDKPYNESPDAGVFSPPPAVNPVAQKTENPAALTRNIAANRPLGSPKA